MRKLRSWWRRHFRPEPPVRLDGLMILWYMTFGNMTPEQASARRSAENQARKQRWLEGYRF